MQEVAAASSGGRLQDEADGADEQGARGRGHEADRRAGVDEDVARLLDGVVARGVDRVDRVRVQAVGHDRAVVVLAVPGLGAGRRSSRAASTRVRTEGAAGPAIASVTARRGRGV